MASPFMRSAKVFILDDDDIHMDDFVKALKGHGMTVSFCRTGLEAIRRYPMSAPYDLMLLNQGLHGDRDGGEEFADVVQSAPIVGVQPRVIIHDGSRDGISRMVKVMGDKGYVVSWLQFGLSLIQFLEQWSEEHAYRVQV